MIRWPGKIKPGQISNEIVGHHDWLPTFAAIAGDAQLSDKLLKGDKAGGTNYKIHLDGYNLVPCLTGQVDKSPRSSFICVNDDQQVTTSLPHRGRERRSDRPLSRDFEVISHEDK